MFVDEVKIYIKAGNGGNGCVSFRREKYVPRGGPHGGDGGKGGDIILQADRSKHTLLDFKYHPHLKAEKGRHGSGKHRRGKDGCNLIAKVPIGTVIYDVPTGVVLADLVHNGDCVVVARGGSGGRGNARFTSPTNRAPRFAEPGEAGENKVIKLELKLIADAGFVGLPNAGKSTLISCISAAHPKIASYPFTTVTPHLGTVKVDEYHNFVIADVPGLIKNAHAGMGMGIKFLKHLERTTVLVQVIDISKYAEVDPVEAVETIREELSYFNVNLPQKIKVVVGNKMDLPYDNGKINALKNKCTSMGLTYLGVSGISGMGIPLLKNTIWNKIQKDPS